MSWLIERSVQGFDSCVVPGSGEILLAIDKPLKGANRYDSTEGDDTVVCWRQYTMRPLSAMGAYSYCSWSPVVVEEREKAPL